MHPLPSHNSGILALEAPHHHRHAALPQHALQCATVNRDFGDNITFSTSLDIPTGGIAVISMVSQSRLFKLGLQHAASLRFINEQVYPPTKPLPPRAVPLAAAAPSCALSCCLPASLTPPPLSSFCIPIAPILLSPKPRRSAMSCCATAWRRWLLTPSRWHATFSTATIASQPRRRRCGASICPSRTRRRWRR